MFDLNEVVFEQISPAVEAAVGGLPTVTHRGVLKVMDLEIEVFRLSNGQAVISEEGMAKFLAWLEGC